MLNKKVIVATCLTVSFLLHGCAFASPYAVYKIDEQHKKEEAERAERKRIQEEIIAKDKAEKLRLESEESIKKVVKNFLNGITSNDSLAISENSTEDGFVFAYKTNLENIQYIEDATQNEKIAKWVATYMYQNIFKDYTITDVEVADNRATCKISAEGILDLAMLNERMTVADFKEKVSTEISTQTAFLADVKQQYSTALSVVKSNYKAVIHDLEKGSVDYTISLVKDTDSWLIESISTSDGTSVELQF